MLFPYAPLPPPNDLGGTKRNLPFLLELTKRHEVTVLSFGTKEEEQVFRRELEEKCSRIVFVDRRRLRIINGLEQIVLLATGRSTFRQIYRKSMQQQIDLLTSQHRFDVIHCCTQFFGYFHFPANIAVVSDTHEVAYDLLFRMYKEATQPWIKILNYLKSTLGKREEIQICKKFDTLIATTERDFKVFQKDLPDQQLFVVGNGVQKAFLEYPHFSAEENAIVFTGKMDFYPNQHGINRFLDEIFPLILQEVPSARIYIVGAYPSKELKKRASANVIVTGYVDDVRPYMSRGAVYVIPLWIGGGIRGKALEAMAMKKPIVTTHIGCESIKLSHRESALFGDTPREFASAVVECLRDKDLCNSLTTRAHATVLKEYNWESQGLKLEKILEDAIVRKAKQDSTYR